MIKTDKYARKSLEIARNKIKDSPYLKGITIEDYFLSELVDFVSEKENCTRCTGYESCPNKRRGFEPFIRRDIYLSIGYRQCNYLDEYEIMSKAQLYYASPIGNCTLEDFESSTSERKKLLDFAKNFVADIKSDKKPKGLLIMGEYSSGKSFFLKCLSRTLSEKGINNIMVFSPDFSREIKSALSDNTSEGRIDELKKAPVLMIDDIGGEHVSDWVRDEVYLPIINHRVRESLPTFYTSNLTLEGLGEHYATGKKSVDNTKALRIVERIKASTLSITLKDKYQSNKS